MQPFWILKQLTTCQVEERVRAQKGNEFLGHRECVHEVPVGWDVGTILLQVALKNFVVKAVAIVGKKENQAIRLVRIDPIYNFKHTLEKAGRARTSGTLIRSRSTTRWWINFWLPNF